MHETIFIIAIAGVSLYLLPTVIATAFGVKRLADIFGANLIIGWTVIGWVATLVWVISEWRRSRDERDHSSLEAGSSRFDQFRDKSHDSGDRSVLGHRTYHA